MTYGNEIIFVVVLLLLQLTFCVATESKDGHKSAMASILMAVQFALLIAAFLFFGWKFGVINLAIFVFALGPTNLIAKSIGSSFFESD